MPTIRVKPIPKTHFMFPHEIADNRELSFEATGLLVYLLSKGDNWTAQLSDIEKRGGIGREARRRIVAELERAGYFQRTVTRDEFGKVDYEIVVHENPLPVQDRTATCGAKSFKTPQTGFPSTANPATAEPATANPSPYIEHSSSKNSRNINTVVAKPTTTAIQESANGNLKSGNPEGRNTKPQAAPATPAPPTEQPADIFDALVSRKFPHRKLNAYERELLNVRIPAAEITEFRSFAEDWFGRYPETQRLRKVMEAYQDERSKSRAKAKGTSKSIFGDFTVEDILALPDSDSGNFGCRGGSPSRENLGGGTGRSASEPTPATLAFRALIEKSSKIQSACEFRRPTVNVAQAEDWDGVAVPF